MLEGLFQGRRYRFILYSAQGMTKTNCESITERYTNVKYVRRNSMKYPDVKLLYRKKSVVPVHK